MFTIATCSLSAGFLYVYVWCVCVRVYVVVAEQLGKCETCVSHWIQNIDGYKFKLHIFHSCPFATHSYRLFFWLICFLARDSCCVLLCVFFGRSPIFLLFRFLLLFVFVAARIIEFLNRLAQRWSLKGGIHTHLYTNKDEERQKESIRPLTMLLTLPLSLAILFQNGWISIWAHLDYNRARSVCVRVCVYLNYFLLFVFSVYGCMFSRPFSVWSVFKQHWHGPHLTFDANI